MGLKEMWAEARYRKRVGEWARECALADDQYERARKADAGMFTSDRARLEPGERLCGEFNAGLSETRRVRVTNYGSVSHQTHSGNRVRAGQARSTSIDELQVIDSGTVVITDRRVQFLGARHNRELRWRNLADNPQVGRGSMTFRSAGRQKPLVFTFHPSGTEQVSFDVHLALALFDGAGSSNVQRLADRLEQLKTHPPQRPPGIELDVRVAALAPIKQVAALAAPSTVTRQALHLPHGCFIHTGPEEVAVSAAALGFTAKLLTWPGSDAKLAASGPVIHDIPLSAHTTALGVELTVVSGDVDQVWAILEATRPRHSVVVSASELEGIGTLDGPGVDTSVLHTDVVQADVLADERRESGATVHRLECTAPLSATSTMILGCEARLMRAVTHRPQLLLVCGPGEFLPNPDTLDGFDEVVVVTTDNEPLEDDPADEVDAVLAVETPITVAGVTVADPAARVLRYLYDHARTVRKYDMTAGHYEAVTQELIAATRVLASRISDNQATWLIDRAKAAPWDLVPRHSDLADADPCQRGGLYDHASELFAHFRSAAPKGVKAAKIYKVLHLMRPELFPILDSRLAARYDLSAKQAANAVNVCRDDLPTSKYAYWAAIRQDLLNNTSALAAIRGSLMATDDPYIVEVVGRLSDVRILDIITWVAADNDSTPSPEDL